MCIYTRGCSLVASLYMYVFACVLTGCMHACMHVCMYACMYMYVYMHAYIHVHTNKRGFPQKSCLINFAFFTDNDKMWDLPSDCQRQIVILCVLVVYNV